MKWIKASERLPDKAGCYHIIDHRNNGNRNSTSWFDPKFRGQSLLRRFPDRIEWLEIETPKQLLSETEHLEANQNPET